MESYYKLTEVQKEKHPYFKFFINLIHNEKDKNYLDKIFNLPKLPLIGIKNEKEKNNNSHLLGKLLSLVSFQIEICQGKEKNQIDQLFSDFVLPENINEYLNIEEVIEIDNNTDEPEVNLYFMPKKKLNFYFIISELPLYFKSTNITNINNNNKISNNTIEDNNNINDNIDEIDFFNEDKHNLNTINDDKNNLNKIKDDKNKLNKIKDNKQNLNKINIINEEKNNNKKYINDDKNEIDINDIDFDNNYNYSYNKFDFENEYEDIEEENNNHNDDLIYNLIPHFFYLNDKEDDLLEIKSLFFNKQISLFCLPRKDYYDIDRENNKNFIDINNLRAESSNIFLNNKKYFKIEPDNLKFYLNIQNDFSQFYIIYASDEDDHHSVFYYITCNNMEAKNKMENILNKSLTLKEVINEIEKCFGKNDIVLNLKNVFCNK